MDKLMSMVVAFGAIAIVMFHFAEAQTVHVVGDTNGWRIPSDDASSYTTWAAGKNFAVGDTLVFNFTPDRHDVQQVQKTSYDACSSTNAIGQPILTSPANITLDSAGEHYYICTFTGHCQGGQKLAINVSGTSNEATPPTTGGSTMPPPTTGGSTTPPPTTGGSTTPPPTIAGGNSGSMRATGSFIASFSSIMISSLSIALTFFY